ncbi:putative D-galacturonate reductase [Dioscorea sansibarensis]
MKIAGVSLSPPLPSTHLKGLSIPEVTLSTIGARPIPLVGMGTATYPFSPETTKPAILHAIELGYRHFDTASFYRSEEPLGAAITEALKLGFIKSRAELFITSKLWCNDCHPHLVLPALKKSLRTLQLDYLDLYLIHFPISSKPEGSLYPLHGEELLPLDLKPLWEAMEECQKLGLVKAIGVSNFSCKLIEELLSIANIPPAVNQVEMHPVWQQKELREYCRKKGIHVTAYSPIGGQDGELSRNMVMACDVLKQIAEAHAMTVAQVSLRWVYEQGVSLVVKSFNKERIKENLQIFDWELSDDERYQISLIPQSKKITPNLMVLGEPPKSLDYDFA